MTLRHQDPAGGRPFNNLLRRLNDADFALVEPHLVATDANPNDLLYSPGDDVETVSTSPAVALLLSKGANPKFYDSHGKSALSYARDKKLTDIIALLETALTKKDKPKFQEWSL